MGDGGSILKSQDSRVELKKYFLDGLDIYVVLVHDEPTNVAVEQVKLFSLEFVVLGDVDDWVPKANKKL